LPLFIHLKYLAICIPIVFSYNPLSPSSPPTPSNPQTKEPFNSKEKNSYFSEIK